MSWRRRAGIIAGAVVIAALAGCAAYFFLVLRRCGDVRDVRRGSFDYRLCGVGSELIARVPIVAPGMRRVGVMSRFFTTRAVTDKATEVGVTPYLSKRDVGDGRGGDQRRAGRGGYGSAEGLRIAARYGTSSRTRR